MGGGLMSRRGSLGFTALSSNPPRRGIGGGSCGPDAQSDISEAVRLRTLPHRADNGQVFCCRIKARCPLYTACRLCPACKTKSPAARPAPDFGLRRAESRRQKTGEAQIVNTTEA